MKKKILLMFLILFSPLCFSQGKREKSRDEVERQIEEIMKAREEMFRSLLNDSGFQNFDKQFEDMVDKFQKGSLVPGTDSDTGTVIGEYDWRETETHQIFVLKVKQIKDKPLDIKIEKGQIKLKGDVESAEVDPNPKRKKKNQQMTKIHFERTFTIPEGVDQANPEFENKAGELLIKFKKLNYKKTSPKKLNDEVVPVPKQQGDIII